MALTPLGGLSAQSLVSAGSAPKAGGFGQVMKAQPKPVENAPLPVRQQGGLPAAGGGGGAAPSGPAAAGQLETAEKVLARVTAAQRKMDQILQAAESGRTFSPAELLSLQAHVYRASQELDLAGKVVEKATNGVKQVLQTQV